MLLTSKRKWNGFVCKTWWRISFVCVHEGMSNSSCNSSHPELVPKQTVWLPNGDLTHIICLVQTDGWLHRTVINRSWFTEAASNSWYGLCKMNLFMLLSFFKCFTCICQWCEPKLLFLLFKVKQMCVSSCVLSQITVRKAMRMHYFVIFFLNMFSRGAYQWMIRPTPSLCTTALLMVLCCNPRATLGCLS